MFRGKPPKFVEKEGWLFVGSIFPVQLGTRECVPLFLFGLNDLMAQLMVCVFGCVVCGHGCVGV